MEATATSVYTDIDAAETNTPAKIVPFSSAENDNEVSIRGSHDFTIYPKDFHPSKDNENEEQWMVVKYKLTDGTRIIATGVNLPIAKYYDLMLHGKWETSEKYGKSFKVSSFEIILPTTKQGISKYLTSLKVGIGVRRANLLYERFGEKLWDVLETQPKELVNSQCINEKALKKLIDKLNATKVERLLRQMFSDVVEIGSRRIRSIVKALGKDAPAKLKENPYLLCTVNGFSFKTADKLAEKLKFPFLSQERIYAGVRSVLASEEKKGHTCVPKGDFKTKILYLLNQSVTMKEDMISDEQVGKAINELYTKEEIKCQANFIYSKNRYDQEVSLNYDLVRLLTGTTNCVSGVERIIDTFEAMSGMTLADSQRKAVSNAFEHQVSIVTGGPGTGKTTIIKAILYVNEMVFGKESTAVLLSPTGRAARRMADATNHDAKTIHSAVSFTGEETERFDKKSKPDKLEGNLFVVDESSMMDLYIAAVLMRRIPNDARIVFVGDPDQLPSVGCGNVLYEMIRSRKIPTTKLNVIFRQADESPIIGNAAKIREGDTDLNFTNQFILYKEQSAYDMFKKACSLYVGCVKKFGLDDVILLNPCRNKSELTVNAFNLNLQHLLNPYVEGQPEMIRDKNVHFRKGDKVMQMKNTKNAMNGDVGIILSINDINTDPDDETVKSRVANIEFNNSGNVLTYTEEDIQNLDLAYCTTIHKSQGSEYGTVIIIMSMQHEMMLRRNLIYTGVTRAKTNVAIITEAEGTTINYRGDPNEKTALSVAIENDKADIRYSLLGDRLNASKELKRIKS